MSDIQSVKEKIDLVEIIRSKMPLVPAGKNLKGLCPFHKEKTPSFVVSPDRQVWHCFGCGKGGDVFKFLMEYENVEFYEALKLLAEKAGITLTGGGSGEDLSKLFEINRAAKDYFHAAMKEAAGPAKTALDYLLGRGLTKETIEEFEIGFAPNSQDGLARTLTKAGHRIQDVERAGLVFKTDRGTYWDRFRSRIMFPLMNQFGKTLGFTGRVMPGEEGGNTGKYVNSPETPIFNKSKLLFGLHKSKEAIRETRAAILVEGQMDFLMTWQDGVKNIVATSGTALTEEHLKTLKRFTDRLVLVFDRDEAGQLAAERTIDLAAANDFETLVIDYSKFKDADIAAKDPADIVRAKPGFMKQLVAVTEPAMEFYFKRYLKPGSAADRKNQIRTVLLKLRNLRSPVERSTWLKELARRTGLDETVLYEEMNQLPKTEVAVRPPGAAQEAPLEANVILPQTRKEAILVRLLSLVGRKESFKKDFETVMDFVPEEARRVYDHLVKGGEIAPELQPTVDYVALRSGLDFGADEAAIEREFKELIRQLKRETLLLRRRELQVKIREAEISGNDAALQAGLREFDTLSKEMQNA